jgi:hypothetical protein
MSGLAARSRKRHKLTVMTDEIATLKRMRSALVDQLGPALNGKRDSELELDIVARALLHVVFLDADHEFILPTGNKITSMDWLCAEFHAALTISKQVDKAMEEMEKAGVKPGAIPEEAAKALEEARAAVEAEPKPAYTPPRMRGGAPG